MFFLLLLFLLVSNFSECMIIRIGNEKKPSLLMEYKHVIGYGVMSLVVADLIAKLLHVKGDLKKIEVDYLDLKGKEQESKNVIETLEKERDDLLLNTNKVDLLRDEVEKLGNENLEKIDEIDKLKEDFLKKENELKNQKEEFDAKLAKVNPLLEKQYELNGSLELDKVVDQTINDLNIKITELKNQMDRKEIDQKIKTDEISHLNADLEKQEDILKDLLAQKSEKENKIEEKRRLYDEVFEEITNQEKYIQGYESLLKNANQELSAIEKNIESLNCSIAKIEEVKKLKNGERSCLNDKKSVLDDELFKLNKSIQVLSSEISDLEKKNEKAMEHEVLLKKLREERDGELQKRDGIDEDIKKVKDLIVLMEKNTKSRSDDLLNYQKQKNALDRELIELNEQIQTLNEQITESERVREETSQSVEVKNGEIKKLNKTIITLESDKKYFDDILKERNDELLGLREKASNLKKECDEKTNEIATEKESADKFEKQVQDLELEVNEIKAKHEKMDIRFRELTEQKEANSVVDDLCKLINQGKINEFKQLFDSIKVENSDIGRKYLVHIIQPIFNSLINLEYTYRECRRPGYVHILKSGDFLSSFVSACFDDNYQQEFAGVLSSMNQLSKSCHEWTTNIDFIRNFYDSFIKKIIDKQVPYFIFNAMVNQLRYLSDFAVQDFFKSLISTMPFEMKQRYFDDCLENLYSNYKNQKVDLFFYGQKYQISFLLCLFIDYDIYLKNNKSSSSLIFSKDQFQLAIKFPVLFEGMVNYIEQNSPDLLPEYLSALVYDEKNINQEAFRIIRDMSQKYKIQKNDFKNDSLDFGSVNENNALNVVQNPNRLIDKSSSTKEDSSNREDNIKQGENQIKTTSQKIEIVEIKKQNNNLSQIQNNNVINESKQMQINPIIIENNEIENNNNAIQNRETLSYYEEQVKTLCAFIEKGKNNDFCKTFDAIELSNDKQEEYLLFLILPIFTSLANCKDHPNKCFEHVLKSEQFLNSLAAIIENNQKNIINDIFTAQQLVMKRDFYDKKNIIERFFVALFKRVKPNVKLPYSILKIVMIELQQNKTQSVLKNFICQMSSELKQQYFDEVLGNLCYCNISLDELLFFDTKEQQIQFLGYLCSTYGTMPTDDVYCNPYSLQFSKEQLKEATRFPKLFKTMVYYVEYSSPAKLYDFFGDLLMDKNVIKIIENHKMENDILQEKDVSRWYMKLRQKININFFLHPSFMLSMNKKQFLQFAQFQVHHFFEKEKDNNTYVTGYDDPLFSNMIFDSFIKLVTTNQKLLNKLQKQLIYAAQCDPLSFFFLSRKRDFCSIYCKDVTKYKACGVKGWLRIFFPEAKIQAFFHSLLEIYDFLQEIEFKIHDCDIAPLKHMVKNVRIIEKTPLDTKYKARFYQLCCDWLCENQTMQHKDFIRSLNKVWRVAKNSFNKADQMTRDGEVLKIQNCAKDTYYRSMFDLQQFDQERPTHQTRQERLRAIQKYNLDPVCSIDEAATYIHGFSNKPDMFGLLEN